jgi:hypothetical protein
LAKYFLQAAWQAHSAGNSFGTNMISRVTVSWFQRSGAELCFGGASTGGEVIMNDVRKNEFIFLIQSSLYIFFISLFSVPQ